MKIKLSITLLAIVAGLLLMALFRTTVPQAAHSTASAPPAPVTPTNQVKPAIASIPVSEPATPSLTEPQRRAIDAAFTLKRPAYNLGEFESLLLNPHLNKLHLSKEQIQSLQQCSDNLYQERLALEASIAQAKSLPDGSVQIDVPPYPTEGAKFQTDFNAVITSLLGDQTAAAVLAEYGGRIAAENADFGVRTQSFHVSIDPNIPGSYDVQESWSNPDGSSGKQTDVAASSQLYFYGALTAFFPSQKD